MDRPARLPVGCPRCENRGVLALDDDRTIACPLCNKLELYPCPAELAARVVP
jgi:hypothetical protein